MLNSLRTRLPLIFIGLVILPLVIVGVLITQRGYTVLQEQSITFQTELAQRTAISLQSFFDQRTAELRALTEVAGLDTLTATDQRNLLLTLLSKQIAYYQLILVDDTGRETIRVTRGEVVTDSSLSDRSADAVYTAALGSRAVTFGEVYFNTAARDRLITVAVPIEDLFTGRIGLVLMAEVRFQSAGDTVLRALNLPPGQDVFILAEDGTIVAHRNPNRVIRGEVFTPPAADGRTTGLSGEDVVLSRSVAALGNQQLTVIAENSFANATALANDLSAIALVITLAALVLAGAIIAFAANRIVQPILDIAQVAAKVEKGDLSARASEQGRGEIAALGYSFNRMTEELQRTLDGLRANEARLAATVKDLEAAKRLAEENSRLKSEFLSTMSHELRTPLNAIEGFTGVVLKKIGGAQFNEKTEEYLRRVHSNSRRLLQLINDFLDLSRVEAGRLELANQPFEPARLAQRWHDEISVLAEKKGLVFEHLVDETLPATLYGDEEAISKVAINLLSNAIKFTEEGRVCLKIDRRDTTWDITVIDSGIGIPPHAREFIFEEFRQVDGSSKRKYGGTGLGLAIVQKYTRSMGGSVGVKSELGQGSTFTVTLPLKTNA